MTEYNEHYAPYAHDNEWWFDDFKGGRRGPFVTEEQATHRARLAEEMYGNGFDDVVPR